MGVKKYFKREFKADKFSLEYDNGPDFYLCCWQTNRSTLPLLFLRALIFGGCVAIWVVSIVMTTRSFNAVLWFIFLTHWGLVMNTLASGLGLVVSLRAFFKGPIDASISLPWYVKLYWAWYNIAVPIAFFITVFYWSLLTGAIEEIEYAIDPVLDVFVHGINAVLMLALTLVSRHPTRILHFYWSVLVGLIYMVFSIIFHFAGGTSPFGTSWIYPMLDWARPGMTIPMVIGSAIGIIIMHLILVGFTVARDKLTQRFRDSNIMNVSDERFG